MKRILKTIGYTLAFLLVLAVLLIFIIPSIFSFIWGDDILPIDDSNMTLHVIDVLEDENAYFDMEKINDTIQIENIPNNISSEFLNSNTWDDNEVARMIDDNKIAFFYFDEAASKNFFQSPQTVNPDDILTYKLPVSMNKWRRISQLSSVKAINLNKQGRSIEAINEAFKSIAIGDLIESSQCDLITYLVGISIKENGVDTLDKVLTSSLLNKNNFKERLSSYNMKNNDIPLKVEYLMGKNNWMNISNIENYQGDVPFIENNFYFKPNLTINYHYELFNDLINEYNKNCDDKEEIELKNEIEIDSFSDVVKLYFTENAIGKMLYSVSVVSLSNIKTKKCEIQGKIDAIIN